MLAKLNELQVVYSHPTVPIAVNNLGTVLRDLGRNREAIPLMEQALEKFRINYGNEHQNVARVLNNLAATYNDLNQWNLAAPKAEEAISIYEKLFPEGHPHYAYALNTQASLLRDQGQPEAARSLYERALAMLDQHPEDATRAAVHENFGRYYYDQQLFDEAESQWLAAHQLLSELHANDNPALTRVRNYLEQLYTDWGRPDKAATFAP